MNKEKYQTRVITMNTLLSNLKSTVELLLNFPIHSLTTQYGAIERLRLAILAILTHGLRQVDLKIQIIQLFLTVFISEIKRYLRTIMADNCSFKCQFPTLHTFITRNLS